MPKPSLLADYAANYGSKLKAALGFGGPQVQSALEPQQPPPPTGQGPYVPPQDPIVPVEPGGSADPEGGQDMGGPMGSPLQQGSTFGADGSDQMEPVPAEPGSELEGKEGYSFRQAWKDAPAPAKERELTKLEQTLKQGNQTIDDAYDDMVKQLGAPPDKNRNLSRQEKGMLLMEFGLSMLANSRKGLATAAGVAGTETLGDYAKMKQQPALQYQADRQTVEAARSRDKAKLATQSALESVKAPAAGRLPGRFTGKDGFVYFYDEDGKARKATDDKGQPIQGSDNENQIRPSEFEVKRKAYMEAHGSRDGRPLSALEMRRVEKDALDFAADRGKTLDDLDLDIQSERSADDFIRSNNELFRDMTPDQVNEYRNKLASERRRRLRRPDRSYLEPNEPNRGRPNGGVTRKFTSEQEARDAFRRGEIKVGDRISVNGLEDVVE